LRTVDFPWDRLDGRPLIYASLGTVTNRHDRLYRLILCACAEIDAQLVLSLGGTGTPDEYSGAPGNAVIVNFAPQRELLGRATIAITHAGLNSTLESLKEGLPLVAIPIAFEQPGIAARIRWTGAGQFIPLSRVTSDRLRTSIRTVLKESSYRESAMRIGNSLAHAGGAAEAARIVEEVTRTGNPLLR
jgi:zeaxanthin glucosyltransferase